MKTAARTFVDKHGDAVTITVDGAMTYEATIADLNRACLDAGWDPTHGRTDTGLGIIWCAILVIAVTGCGMYRLHLDLQQLVSLVLQ